MKKHFHSISIAPVIVSAAGRSVTFCLLPPFSRSADKRANVEAEEEREEQSMAERMIASESGKQPTFTVS